MADRSFEYISTVFILSIIRASGGANLKPPALIPGSDHEAKDTVGDTTTTDEEVHPIGSQIGECVNVLPAEVVFRAALFLTMKLVLSGVVEQWLHVE